MTSESPSLIVTESHDENRPLKKTRLECDDIEFKPAARTASQSVMPLHLLQPQTPPGYMTAAQRIEFQVKKRREIADVIAAANAAAEAEAARLAAVTAAATMEPPPEVVKKKPKASKKLHSKEEKESNKERRLLKLVGAVVVKCMSKYSGKMEAEVFKKYAKEVCSFFFASDGLLLTTL